MAQATRDMGEGGSGGTGGGGGGSGQDGYSVAGTSVNVPAYGPDRLQFSNSQVTSSLGTGDGLAGRGQSGDSAETANSTIQNESAETAPESTIIPENIPEKYRTALKLYFTPTQ